MIIPVRYRGPRRRMETGCCLGQYTEIGSWYPQRWDVDAGSWSWSIPTGLTQYDLNGPLSPAVEPQIAEQEFHSLTAAHPLSGLGSGMTAWSFHASKYGGAFGSIPASTPYGPTYSGSTPDFMWLAVDDTSLWQAWHDAYAIVRNGTPYEKISLPAELHSAIVPMLDTTDNTSGATPWRDYDGDELVVLGMSYEGCFADDMRIGASGYTIPWGIGDECNEDVAWQAAVAPLGNSIEVGVRTDGDGRCWWIATVRIRPRFSVWSNGILTREEYYRTTVPDPPDLYANGYIRNVTGGDPTKQASYPGRFGFVHPGVPKSDGYQSYEFADRGWTIPPYLIADYTGVGVGVFRFNDSTRLRNNAGPGNESLSTSDPPGGWRSWIEVYYESASPINCQRDLIDADPVTLQLVTDNVPVIAYSTAPGSTIPWSDWLDFMSDAWGLGSPPSTITIQRLADL